VVSDGSPAVAAMSAGNLLAAATWAREVAASGADIVILADNDVRDDGSLNTGVEAALKAATAVGGRVAIPEMDGLKCDFWDLWDKHGPGAVKRAIGSAKAPEAPTPQPDEKNAPSDILGGEVSLIRGDSITPEPVSWIWGAGLLPANFMSWPVKRGPAKQRWPWRSLQRLLRVAVFPMTHEPKRQTSWFGRARTIPATPLSHDFERWAPT